MARLGIISVLASLWANTASAACQLALVLALDVSTSVDAREYRLQRDGLAAALNSATVRSALFSGQDHIALSVFEWSGQLQQRQILDWTEVKGPDELNTAVAAISDATRSFDNFPTAMGHALMHGRALFENAPICDRRVIDISGDGYNNDGMDPPWAYRWNDFGDITVNGLVIRTTDHRVPIYYEREVIRGPDAFVEVARNYEDFERAMRRKLVREIGVLMLGYNEAGPKDRG